jgi:hypothetical protein
MLQSQRDWLMNERMTPRMAMVAELIERHGTDSPIGRLFSEVSNGDLPLELDPTDTTPAMIELTPVDGGFRTMLYVGEAQTLQDAGVIRIRD